MRTLAGAPPSSVSLPVPPVTFSTSVLTLSVSPDAPSLAVPSIETVTAKAREE